MRNQRLGENIQTTQFLTEIMRMGENKIKVDSQEIWDDSALIDSWNQALEEYKKYHSMHARGIKLEQLKDEVEASTARYADHAVHNVTQPDSDSQSGHGNGDQAEMSHFEASTPSHAYGASHTYRPPPQVLLGSIKDENLKKLLMSWYYAGYYTGLYEGGQQAEQPQGK